ncbi:hypothetical protein [Yinghuangia soli]|uniref:Uncharacterized protein n=1 Tax=Yinghuangia soli TaxID=2908204 RepID=A0AA41PTQ4_9ACTN|nr:hypothetical protein [Yinghuangia soli]MCF2525700.1 hypothetical protein [Yinghuangia soli]
MEAELAALAASGATTLVGLMASDAWEHGRTRIAALFGRTRPEQEELVASELDSSRSELLAAGDDRSMQAAEELEVEWRVRLRRLLAADPAAAAELREILEDLSTDADVVTYRGDHVEFHHNTFYGPVVGKGPMTSP